MQYSCAFLSLTCGGCQQQHCHDDTVISVSGWRGATAVAASGCHDATAVSVRGCHDATAASVSGCHDATAASESRNCVMMQQQQVRAGTVS